jgi:dipeptidyl aminopeptidase/acylaminoacyl peptidase
MGIPAQFAEMLLMGTKMQITQLTGMKLEDLKPVDYAPKCKVPALFIHGCEDDFIEMSHT